MCQSTGYQCCEMMALGADVELFRSIVEKVTDSANVCITNVTFKNVGEEGGNYTSNVKRIIVNYKCGGPEKEMSLFLKQENGIDDDILHASFARSFDTETTVMSGPLKRMNQILDSTLAPQLLYARHELPYLIIMEDLTPLGFTTTDRLISLDLPHSLLAIRYLARFHASSVAVFEETPAYKGQFNRFMFRDVEKNSALYVYHSIRALAKEIGTWEGYGSKYEEKFRNLAEIVMDKVYAIFVRHDDEFNVLTHGDPTQLNCLFTYDPKKNPLECILVDYQFACYNSPGNDLQYFISCSVSQEVYQHHLPHLLKEYHSELSQTMTKLHCKTPIPTHENILKIYNNRALIGLITTIAMEPVVHAKPSDIVPLDVIISDAGTANQQRFKRPEFKQLFTARLAEYESLGLLDQ